MRTEKQEIKVDKRLSFFVIFFFVIQGLNGTVKTLLPFLPDEIKARLSILSGIILLFVMISSFGSVVKRSRSVVVISYILFGILYILGILQSLMRGDPINLLLGSSAFWTFVWWLPIGLFAYSIKDKSILYDYLLKGSYVLSIILMTSLLPVILKLNIFDDQKEYNMFFSYMLIFPLLLHINEYLRNKKSIILLLFLAELCAILLYGSRGALLCLMSFAMLKIFYGQISYAKKVVVPVILFLGILVFSISAKYIVEFLADYNLSSRTLDKIVAHDMQKGRDYIWKAGVDLILEKPLFGYGLGGEFYQMSYKASEILGRGRIVSEVQDLTPHNGFLQLMLNFGVLIGIIIGLYILFSILKLQTSDHSHLKDMLIILFSVFIIPAMTVSDGIFVKPGIALYLFLVLDYKKHIVYEKN